MLSSNDRIKFPQINWAIVTFFLFLFQKMDFMYDKSYFCYVVAGSWPKILK